MVVTSYSFHPFSMDIPDIQHSRVPSYINPEVALFITCIIMPFIIWAIIIHWLLVHTMLSGLDADIFFLCRTHASIVAIKSNFPLICPIDGKTIRVLKVQIFFFNFPKFWILSNQICGRLGLQFEKGPALRARKINLNWYAKHHIPCIIKLGDMISFQFYVNFMLQLLLV